MNNLATREDMARDLWELYGETVKAVKLRMKSDDCKPADIANAIKLLQNNSMSLPPSTALKANPNVILDQLHTLPFIDSAYDYEE